MAADSILIGIPEIAEIAKVSRPAVSNWRKRYDDFPEPRVQSDSGVLFDLRAIEEWLLARGKIDQPIPHGMLVWRVAEALRASWPGETLFESTSSMLFEFTSSWLCYLEACARAADSGTLFNHSNIGVKVLTEHRWTTVRESSNAALAKRLRAAAKAIEAANPRLAELLDQLAPEPFPDPLLVRSFAAELEAAADDITPRFALFEEGQQNVVEVARASGEWTTPDDLAHLVAELVGKVEPGATIVDPACGTGGLLLMAAVRDQVPDSSARFVGADINQVAARYARARFFLYGIDAEIERLDSLRRDPSEWPAADVVLCDPPYGLSNWGDADLYRSGPWAYGSPPPKSADLAWVQLAIAMLNPEGRAAVVLPPGSCFRGGREALIREALVRAGVIEAVIHLPPRLRRDTSIPLTIWLLTAAPSASDAHRPVLLVDASELGTPGRSTHELSEEAMDELVRVVQRWRTEGTAEPTGALPSVAVDVDTLIDNSVDLTPRRYLGEEIAVDLGELREMQRSARSDAEVAAREVEHALAAFDALGGDDDNAARITGSTRLRLGEVAEVFRPRGDKGQGGEASGEVGDLVLATTHNGFSSRLLGEGEEVSGLHAIVIRALPGGPVTPAWLLLWSRTDAFARLAERHSKGSTLRSLSVKDLVDFELDVPSSDAQEHGARLLERLDGLAGSQERLRGAIDELRTAELRLAYSEVAG